MKKSVLVLTAALAGATVLNAQTVFSEDFQGLQTGSLPTGWVAYGDGMANNSNYVQQGLTSDSWFVYNFQGGEAMALSVSWKESETASDRWLVTPAITATAERSSLVFSTYGYNSQYPEQYRVMMSTTGNEKSDFTTTLLDLPNVPAGISYHAVDIPESVIGEPIYIAFVNYGDGYYGGIDDVQVTVMPSNGIDYVGAQVQSNAAQNTDFTFIVGVQNMGRDTLTEFDIEYSLGGGAVQTQHISGVNAGTFEYATTSITASYPTAGMLEISIEVKNPNGDNTVTSANATGTISTYIYDPATTVQRNSLLEHFTTARCVWCPYGHQRLEAGLASHMDRFAWVSHHVGYYTDAMTLNESNEIGNMFNLGGAPMMMIDRNAEFSDGNDAIGSVGQVEQIDQQMEAATSTPAFVSINMSNLTYNEQTREISVTISGDINKDFTNPLNLTLWITEDSIIGVQADAYQGNLQNYVHNHVLRCLVNGIWGESSAFTTTTAGSTYTKTFTYTLPAKIRANKARLVAFVNSYGNGAANRTVENTTKSDFLLSHADPTFVGIAAVDATISIKTYPNPATDMAYIDAEGQTIRSYEIVNELGQKVLEASSVNANMIELRVSDMAEGVYFVTIRTDKGIATERMTVVH